MNVGRLKDFLHELDNLNSKVYVARNGMAYEILDIDVDSDTEDIYFILKSS